ncbi:MAG: hypothetical protein IJ111_04875 [Eggerthellaceae bacterium]|nr:hypothetical protein [Eggerthellaceae bacterium]
MIVKTYYEGGHIVVFDTDHMTESMPQKGNMLTNYSIDLDDVNGERLWLSTYYYEANDQYRDTIGPKGLPVARRRDGWSFLIADDEDMKKLTRVTVDGEDALVRVAGALVDATALRHAYDVAEDIIPKAVKAHRHLVAALANEPGIDIEVEACNRMGFPYETFQAVRRYEPAEEAQDDIDRDLFGTAL